MNSQERIALAKAASHQLTRRGFLRGALGAAVASTVALVGCGGSSDGGSTAEGGANVIRFGVAKPDASFDTQTTSTTIGISENVTEGLYALDPITNEVEPVIAVALPTVSDDGLTYEIEIKDGVKFHDGTVLTANDVKYTFTRLISINAEADSFQKIEGFDALAAGETDELTGLTVQDDTHLTFKLSEPHSSFLRLLCQFYANIYPAAAVEKVGDDWGIATGPDWQTYFGSGPFRIAENDGTSFIRLEAFEDYHEGKPAIDAVEISYVSDDSTLMNMYINGDLDVVFVPKDLIEQYRKDETIAAEMVNYTPCATQFVNLNLNGPEFQDIKVREALSLAINRQELCDTILSGAALPCTGFIPPSESGSDPNGTVLEYNVDRAKELLAEAGNPTISFTAKVRPVDENVMVAIQAKWQEIGVDCKVETMDPQQWRDDRAAGNLVCTLVTWSTLSFVGVEHMGSFFTSDKASLRSSFYNSPEFDAYVQAARSAMDEAEVTENTIKADNKLVREDFGTIPVDWPQNPYVLREGFNGLEVLVDFHFKHVTKA